MSYEGYDEYILEDGTYMTCDCNDSPQLLSSSIKWWHAVDETNGYDENDPSTYPAAKKEIGYEDIWHIDHYGNKYATKKLKFEPNSLAWKLYRNYYKTP